MNYGIWMHPHYLNYNYFHDWRDCIHLCTSQFAEHSFPPCVLPSVFPPYAHCWYWPTTHSISPPLSAVICDSQSLFNLYSLAAGCFFFFFLLVCFFASSFYGNVVECGFWQSPSVCAVYHVGHLTIKTFFPFKLLNDSIKDPRLW